MIVIACAALALASEGISAFRPESYAANLYVMLSAWVLYEIGPFVHSLYIVRPESPFAYAKEFIVRRRHLYRAGLPYIAMIVAFMPTFSAVKSAIPLFNPYSWDATFIAWDRAIFGTDPWLLIQPIFGNPLGTNLLASVYHLWFLYLSLGVVYFTVYCTCEKVRRRFLTSYVAIWAVIGMVCATAFSSVGPAFVKPILGMDTFDAQMAYLRSAPGPAIDAVRDVQDVILYWYFSGQHGLGKGISAMPSMHVALATLMWLAFRRTSKWMGRATFAALVLISLGSVHLAYHYALDGAVAFVLTLVIWRLSGARVALGSVSGGQEGLRREGPQTF
ncbi:phosphatase PAP2 family protein [Qipengyuania oceanensis]|uniref:phosphatase PAP2 family protein n=1 Tax=Qipengyuania oceanensis TaxID=1463597 RepID=UPI00136AD152|nr:phosphatase PAP2 family protein [Qipengyuania oceanensis]